MMLGILGAWRAAWAIARAQDDPRALLTYGDEQRSAAIRVQSSNARIFRQIVLTSPALSGIRRRVMPAAARLTSLETRMARQESLVDEPLPDL